MALGERDRNPLSPRSTAEAACAMRAAGALEKDPAVRCPDDMAAGFLGGFNVTTLAKYRGTRRLVVRAVDRQVPGAYTYEIARCRFIDEVVVGEAAEGLDQLVLLGAGLDSRPYRLADRLRDVRVYEVDHPDSLDSKRTRLRRLLGSEPDHVTFVAADFNRDDLGSVLPPAGYLCSARTLFVCSGLLPYLSEEGASGLLSWIGSHRDPAISVAFDAAWAGAVDGSRDYFGAAELRKRVADTGEPLRWGIPDGRVEETLTRFNLGVERLVDGEELHGAYLERSDGTFHDRPFGFGALIHARAAS